MKTMVITHQNERAGKAPIKVMALAEKNNNNMERH